MTVAQDKTKVIADLPMACADETKAVEFLEATRWKGTPKCARCESEKVRQIIGRDCRRSPRYLWRCLACRAQYTVRVGTVFEGSKIPLRHWCFGFWAACSGKKGVSALEIRRQTGLSYKSALYMMHRIRCAMGDANDTLPPLSGTVEADETYVGGKPRYTSRWNMGRYRDRKAAVLAFVQRGGEVRPYHLERVTSKTVRSVILKAIQRTARLMTDESNLYKKPGTEFEGGHHAVLHSIGEYVRGDVHTNTVEGFFSLLKRGLYGTFHSVSKKHLHRYLSEFQFRWNSRKLEDGERTLLAIQRAVGKRLPYRAQVEGIG
jgi:transposase-like protein